MRSPESAAGDADRRILSVWRDSAAAWTEAVRGDRIESRRLVTDDAIVGAVLEQAPASVLDLGCGEGWLVRALAGAGVRAQSVDAIPALIARADEAGGGEFRTLSYEAITDGGLSVSVDVVVCNFSLLGGDAVAALLAALPPLLNPGGRLVVQTPHPRVTCGDLPYRDGWREAPWDGCGPGFGAPAPWYFRTLESWRALFAASGFEVLEEREPTDPRSGQPASVLFVAVPAAEDTTR